MDRQSLMNTAPHTLPLPFSSDLDHVCAAVGESWLQLKNQNLLITGGTGIVGKWLLASLLHADKRFGLGVRLSVVSRDPGAFKRACPALGHDSRIDWIEGDVRRFELPAAVNFSHVIHAAADVVAPLDDADLLDTCMAGTRHVLAQARRSGASRVLLLSSGAVYGQSLPAPGPIAEDWDAHADRPDHDHGLGSAYAQGKRQAERLAVAESAEGHLAVPIARCFAMLGPYVPLDKHFAVGNFIGAVLDKETVRVKGDGTPVRSYLYMADVTLRLWLLLFKGRGGVAYNVGGDEPLTIRALAQRVVQALDSDVAVCVENGQLPNAQAKAYFPDSSRIKTELGLGPEIGLDEAVARTAAWHRAFRQGQLA